MAVDELDKNCAECKLLVEESDDAFLCDGFCKKWHHAKCVNIKSAKFKKIQDVVDLILWMCQDCITRLSKARNCTVELNDYLNLHGMMGNLLNIVKGITEDNISINNKLDLIEVSNSKLHETIFSRLPEVNVDIKLTSEAVPKPTKKKQTDSKIPVTDQTSSSSNVPKPTADDTIEIDKEHQDMDEDVEGSCRNDSSLHPSDDKTLIDNTIVTNVDLSKTDNCPPRDSGHLDTNNKWQKVWHRKKQKTPTPPQTTYADSVLHGQNTLNRRPNHRNEFASALVHQGNVQKPKLVEKTTVEHAKHGRPKPNNNYRPLPVVVGSSDKITTLTGTKRAWFHLGKVKKGTTEHEVVNFVKDTFPDINVSVEKLDSKGPNDSFRLGVDFSRREDIMNCAAWPMNVTIKRFLFKRRPGETVK